MDDITVKHKEVRFWLENVFNASSIPQYEINETTVEMLYMMSRQNTEMNRIMNLAIEDSDQKKEEYKKEGERLRDILENVGLPIYSLSSAGKLNLKLLTDLALSLDIKDTRKSSYCIAMNLLSKELSLTTSLIARKKEEIDLLVSDATFSLQKLEAMASKYNKAEEHSSVDIPVAEKRQREIVNLKSKCEKYQLQIDEFQKNADLNNMNRNIRHENVVRMGKELKDLKKELKPLLVKIKSYRSLPPDMNLAKVKIEEAKRQLDKLEEELQCDIDLLPL